MLTRIRKGCKYMKNIGNKIRISGKIISILGIVASCIICITNISSYEYAMFMMAWIVGIFGSMLSLFSGWIIQGFGIIVTKAEMTMPKPSPADPLPKIKVE